MLLRHYTHERPVKSITLGILGTLKKCFSGGRTGAAGVSAVTSDTDAFPAYFLKLDIM
jgi:hypothetical protein